MESANTQDIMSVLRNDEAGANQRDNSRRKSSSANICVRGAITPKCRRKYPANGSINNPVNARPLAAIQ